MRGYVWLKCDGCSREYLIDARSVQRGVGDPPLAHNALTREPMTCPWCRHVGVRVVTGSGNGPGATPERRSTPAGSGSAGTSGAAPSLDETGLAPVGQVAPSAEPARGSDETGLALTRHVACVSECFIHGSYDGVFCPTCEKEAGR